MAASRELRIVRGDITQLDVDVVVNAANNRMRGGGGVDGAIHRAGGPAIMADCMERFPRGLATGDAGWTTAGRMPARWVVHTVGPVHGRGTRDQLVSAYRRSVEVAEELGATSIAFPSISAGSYGWPHDDAARCAVEGVSAVPVGSVLDVRFVAFGDEAYAALTAAVSGGRGASRQASHET